MRKNKLYSLALSLLISFGLWLYVVNNVSQEMEATFYNIPVVFVREGTLDEQNLIITGQSTKTVSLKLSGARSDLNKVNSGNMSVTVDLSTIEEPGTRIPLRYNITYPTDVANNAFTVESRNPGYIYVDVDSRRTKEVPVVLQWTGTRSEGYIYDTENAELDYTMVSIMGPAEVADQIDHAVIQIDLTDQVESLSKDCRYTLCNAEGEPVDAQSITTSVDAIRVDLRIQRIKEVQLVANILYGGGTSELNTVVKVEPEVIRLSGSEAVLAELGDTYTVGTINLAELEKSQDINFALTIPEGVNNLTGLTEAVVSVRFSGLSIREFDVSNIEMTNVPEGLEAEIMNTSVKVKVRGPATEISLLTADDITAIVDFAAAEIGNATFKANIVFSEDYPNVGALKTYSVSATVRVPEPEAEE